MLDFLDSFPTYRVAVIGDLMLDCYLYGEVTRISPEAPVPVVRGLSDRLVPGGAANVAVNLATLGLYVDVVGATGNDEARRQLIDGMHAHGRVDTSGVISTSSRTTKKMRIIGAHQQIVRVDYEDTAGVLIAPPRPNCCVLPSPRSKRRTSLCCRIMGKVFFQTGF
jgi:D-beta-D-heptose 7-phosphate kinase/D-beta-D-heptose 1-phosphate adenosyltransferase